MRERSMVLSVNVRRAVERVDKWNGKRRGSGWTEWLGGRMLRVPGEVQQSPDPWVSSHAARAVGFLMQ